MSHPGDGSGPPTIAIVGSGPAGCYTAQFLRKQWRDAEIVVFDRLALPYGLVRYGVAPDHLGTKAVTKQFDRLFERDAVRFIGGTEIGSDITVERLRESFDVVVVATGLPADRLLDAEPTLAGVYGAGAITRLINGHPEERSEALVLGETVTIVGHGNVAIDLVRLFLTPAADLLALGVAEPVVDAIGAGPIRQIEIVGRSAVSAAKFDVAMARELGTLPDVVFESDAAQTTAEPSAGQSAEPAAGSAAGPDARAAVIAELVAGSPQAASRTVRFRFGWTPEALTGTDSVHGIDFVRSDGTRLSIPTDSVCTAIGFSEHDTAALRLADHLSPVSDLAAGVLSDGLYCVGWLRRGPQGTIPANRVDARLVADTIIAAVAEGRVVTGRPGFANILSPVLTKEFS